MTRTEKLLALAEAAIKTDSGAWHESHWLEARLATYSQDAYFIASANPETIKQLVELVRLQHSELEAWCKDIGQESEAIAAFNKFEQGGE